MSSKIKHCIVVYVISVYLLWPVLPLTFGCLWGIDFGYVRMAEFEGLAHLSVELPSIFWWLFSPVMLIYSFAFSLMSFLVSGAANFVLFPGIFPCLNGAWDAFPTFHAIIGWLVAYAFCLFTSVKVCSCKHSLRLQVLCCALSVLALFFCDGPGPYGANIDRERNVIETMAKGRAAPGEEKFGYRFVSDKLAVPLEYGRGNRARTLCWLSKRVDSSTISTEAQIPDGDYGFVLMKDTEGEIEPLPGAAPDEQEPLGLGPMIDGGWRIYNSDKYNYLW